MTPAISLEHLAKVYKVGFLARRVVACRDVSFTVAQGEVFGLVGPNGAGKSTTLRLLLGLARPTSGSGSVLGMPLGSTAARRRMGFLPELPYFPKYLTPKELLDFHARLAGVADAGWPARRDRVLERVGMARAATTRMQGFSKGMLQRCGLAVALCGEPDLLILDEPMSGLDPLGRHHVRNILREEHSAGRTIVFSSHVLADVQALCDRMAVITQGEVYRVGTLEEVTRDVAGSVEIQLTGVEARHHAALAALGTVKTFGMYTVWEVPDAAAVGPALRLALDAGLQVRSVSNAANALEDVIVRANAATSKDGRISP